MKQLLRIFYIFFKIGAFTFGGGYAMIPIIQKEMVENRKWITDEDIIEIIAIAESTPGPIAINSATFVGYRVAGFWGAFCGTLGVILPSFITIFIIATLLREVNDLAPVRYAFEGIRAGVLALLIKALVSMFKQVPKGLVSYIIMGAALIISAFFEINVIFILIGCALAGLISSIVAKRRSEK